MADFEIIDTEKDLRDLAKLLLGEEVIGVDTEADSFYHYYDKTCLVQIASAKDSYLVDPLAMGGPAALEPLGPVFASPKVEVIFHAAEYDLYMLKKDCGFEFSNLFDTMLSAQLLGYPSIGLAALIEHHFGVKLAKHEQRSDWSRRPLTPRQLEYAVGDVTYLIQLTKILRRELIKAKRIEWAEEEFETLMAREWVARPFDKLGYLKIKGARKLDPESLSVLRQLFLVRDKRAREIDRPAFKVLGNRTLLEISQEKPTTQQQLSRIKGVSDLIIRRLGDELLAAVAKAEGKPHGPIPRSEGAPRRRMDGRTEQRLRTLKSWRTPRAAELKMDPGVLCSNATLESIAWTNPSDASELRDAPGMKRWFVEGFGEEIVQALQANAVPASKSEERRKKPRRPAQPVASETDASETRKPA